MLYFLTGVLAVALIVCIIRYRLIKKELFKLSVAMEENHNENNCRQLTIGLRQPQLALLAASINTLYDDIDADRAANRISIDELRKDMTNISHDLRTPLTSIIGYLKLLQNDSASDSTADTLSDFIYTEKQRSYLSIISKKAQDLSYLVSGLFELALLESGDHIFQYLQCDANALLAEELAVAYAQFEKAGTSPEVKLQEGPIWVISDIDAMQRIYTNLLQNMIKHGKAPMRIISVAESGHAYFTFSNGAPELLEKDIPYLFQRFFTADRMRTGSDTGLGLAIVKEFTEQMNGNISAQLKDGLLTITLSFQTK